MATTTTIANAYWELNMCLATVLSTLYYHLILTMILLLPSHYSEGIETSERLFYVMSELRGIKYKVLHNLTLPYLFSLISHNPPSF